jgi:hypothetical protein
VVAKKARVANFWRRNARVTNFGPRRARSPRTRLESTLPFLGRPSTIAAPLSWGCRRAVQSEVVHRLLRDSAPPCLHLPLNAVMPPRGREPRPAPAVAPSSGSRPYRRSDLFGRRELPLPYAPLLSLCMMPKRKLRCWAKNLTPLALDLGLACPNVLDGVDFGRSPRRIWCSRNN